MFDWLWDRLADKLLNTAIKRLQSEKLWKETINPLLDAIIDRQVQRLQGKMGSITKAAIPKIDLSTIAGLFLQRYLGSQGPQTPQQPINSSLPSEV